MFLACSPLLRLWAGGAAAAGGGGGGRLGGVPGGSGGGGALQRSGLEDAGLRHALRGPAAGAQPARRPRPLQHHPGSGATAGPERW